MSFHIYKYSLLKLIKDKTAVFWMLAFPLILATFLNLAFSNMLKGEGFEKIEIAVVNSEQLPEGLTEAMEKSEMFIIETAEEVRAKELLADGKIKGYIKNTDGLELVVTSKGINQSIIKAFLDSYLKVNTTVYNITTEKPELLETGFLDNIDSKNLIKAAPTSNRMNAMAIAYFALLAMTCLFSANVGCAATAFTQANQTAIAARISVAPTRKLSAFASRILATVTFQFGSALIGVFYITQVLKVDFGDRYLHIILICAAGCFTGTMMGAMIGSISKARPETKDILLTNIVLVMCFLSGLMVLNMKYIVQEKAPLLGYINPANLITDGLYSLYYYDTLDRFYLNLGLLSLIGVLFMIVTVLVIRRQKYESI